MNFPTQIRDLALGRPVDRDQDYQVGLRYVIPARAAPAYRQLARTHGLRALRDPRRYAATTFGLEPRDPVPGVWELAETTARLARRGYDGLRRRRRGPDGSAWPPTPVGGLPRTLVNTLDRSGDPGF